MKGNNGAFDLQIKLLMIGDGGVGKTSIILRYSNDHFSPVCIQTIGIDFKIKNILIDDKKVKLLIWDTAGQERFRTITTSYFRGAQGILLVYDVTDRKSFDAIRNWMTQIEMHSDTNVNKILIGNKCDFEEKRVVSLEEGQRLAREYNIQFFETSAKLDLNVEAAFLSIATDVKNKLLMINDPISSGSGVNLSRRVDTAATKKSCC